MPDITDLVTTDGHLLQRDGTSITGVDPATLGGSARQVSIVATTPAVVSTNWDNYTVSNAYPLGVRRFSSGAQNDAIGWDVSLEEGTWGLNLLHEADNVRGIYSVRFDGVEVGTIEGYVAGSEGKQSSISGITVASSGIVRVTLVMATKNASSGSYYGAISALTLGRTGD